jgi:hypothetical protein
VPLQIGLAQPFEWEFLAEGGDLVVEVDAVGVERALLASRCRVARYEHSSFVHFL